MQPTQSAAGKERPRSAPMPWQGRRIGFVALPIGWVMGTLAYGAEPPPPPPALSVRLIRPDLQMDQALGLFRGARAPHPAAALAAWKRGAGPGANAALGKPWEAAIALFNPAMAAELRSFDGAELHITFDPDNGSAHWFAAIPHDDGTFASLATALVLTDGGREPPLDGPGIAVDRLGPPPWPLALRAADRFAMADSREGLRQALEPLRGGERNPGAEGPALESGWLFEIDPQGLGRAGPLPRRRLAEALRGLGCLRISARGGLEHETLALTATLWLDIPLVAAGTVDPAWLDGLPEERLVAVFATTIDPADRAWDRGFALADRIERADPAHAGVAPLRTRINLLAAGAKVRPEVDLWPHLRGLTAALLADRAGAVDGAVVSLHTDSPESAARIAGKVLPALAQLLGLRVPPADDEPRRIGALGHRPVGFRTRGATVRLAWGEPALALIQGGLASGTLRTLLPRDVPPPQRWGAFWPGRTAAAKSLGGALADVLAEYPPIQWSGYNKPPGTREVIRWPGLHNLIFRVLERLPLDPPPRD
jgi:hypothetical protein